MDAALVYRTDVIAAAADVEGIDFPESAKAVNDYPIVALTECAEPGRRGRRSWTTCSRPRARPVLTDSRLCHAALTRARTRASPLAAGRPGSPWPWLFLAAAAWSGC